MDFAIGCYNRSMRFAIACLLLFVPSTVSAYNGLAHKTIAAIAWQRLDKPTRTHIVATLRRHPRFDDDFMKRQPEGVTDEGEWIFQHAATWPDLARSLSGQGNRTKYHRPTWHYLNLPIFQGGDRPLLDVNLSTQYPSPLDGNDWNIIQAYRHCLATLRGDGPPSDKALAYCWLLHLGGDAHQPLHTTALFSERFPGGDRGGNEIPTVQGSNLHALWDGVLGKSHKPNDVKREVAELRTRRTVPRRADRRHRALDRGEPRTGQGLRLLAGHLAGDRATGRVGKGQSAD
jgi:hypothetical protein